jgi:hypothetical protein
MMQMGGGGCWGFHPSRSLSFLSQLQYSYCMRTCFKQIPQALEVFDHALDRNSTSS